MGYPSPGVDVRRGAGDPLLKAVAVVAVAPVFVPPFAVEVPATFPEAALVADLCFFSVIFQLLDLYGSELALPHELAKLTHVLLEELGDAGTRKCLAISVFECS